MGCFGGREGSESSLLRFGLRRPALSSYHIPPPLSSEPGDRCRRRCSGNRGGARAEGGGGGGRVEAPISAKSLDVMSAVASRAWCRRFRRLRGVDEDVVDSEAGGWSYWPFTVPHQLATLAFSHGKQSGMRTRREVNGLGSGMTMMLVLRFAAG